MALPRRTLLAFAPAVLATPALAQGQAPAAAISPDDPRLSERGIGPANAPVKVQEFFSLTCSHCAHFHKETFPRVKQELVGSGQIRLIWRDFPLDRLALAAAAVARSLPPERYEGFIGALLANQDRWAFTRGDPREELGKMAALAGMARATYNQVFADEPLQRAILEGREKATQEYQIQATPTFVFGRQVQSGDMDYDAFARRVQEAKRG